MLKLLIVDDEADVRDFAANFFRKRKIDCLTAASGEEAIALAEKEKPDLILLDIKMNGIDGVEALRQIKEKNSSQRVIMVTGKKPEEQEAFVKCQAYGALDYIHKPLELDKLERIVLAELRKFKKICP